MTGYIPGTNYSGHIEDVSAGFDTGIADLGDQLKTAMTNLQQHPSDPSYLTQYQAVLSEYNLYRSAQSSAVKAIKDIDSAIIANYR
ncbi:type III secretion system needle complex protein [Paraburkholderia sp. BR10882]|uniref:type III secretion system needle complex protein n=1 Tax=unclassified Paraburkholderia TaxID=2615204 RepID=UPI0034CD913F